MLVTFKTNSYANITLFGDVAQAFIRVMGHSGAVPGSLAAAEVPAALSRIKKALDSGNIILPASAAFCDEEDDDQEEDDDKKTLVSLKNRAFPLIALLTAAVASEDSIMWE